MRLGVGMIFLKKMIIKVKHPELTKFCGFANHAFIVKIIRAS